MAIDSKDKSEVQKMAKALSGIVDWQNRIKQEVDINKPDDQLTKQELLQKVVYFALEKTLKDFIKPNVLPH
jgi:hypothetical protein